MISFEVNNGGVLEFTQNEPNGDVRVHRLEDGHKVYGNTIPAGDMVMLHNLYRYIVDNDIHNSFINPYGTKKEYL